MSALDQKTKLQTDRFELYTTLQVAVPFFTWTVALDIEFDRNLHLSEEVTLRLLEAGISDRGQLARLMGLKDDAVVLHILVNLLERGAVEYDDQNTIRLSSVGKRMLVKQLARLTKRFEGIELRHDPYKDELRYRSPQYELTEVQLKVSGLHRLPTPRKLTEEKLEERYQEVQKLVTQYGVKGDNSSTSSRKEVLRLYPGKNKVTYIQAQLEVWFRPEDHKFTWRLLRDGVEDPEISEALHQLEAEGIEIIPAQDPLPNPDALEAKNIEAAAQSLEEQGDVQIIQAHEHRQALKQLILEAQKQLIIISPWMNRGAVDDAMMQWFETSLRQNQDLRIVIGYGIEKIPQNSVVPKDKRTLSVVQTLTRLANRYLGRLELIELGNTHQKIVICDGQRAIVTSFNFLSFNPEKDYGPGVRQETGVLTTNIAAVQKLAADVRHSLNTAVK